MISSDRLDLILVSPQVIDALRPFSQADGDRYVFGSVRSRYQTPAVIDSAWRDAVARAQVRDFRFHDLRHCCASYMAQAGGRVACRHPANGARLSLCSILLSTTTRKTPGMASLALFCR